MESRLKAHIIVKFSILQFRAIRCVLVFPDETPKLCLIYEYVL